MLRNKRANEIMAGWMLRLFLEEEWPELAYGTVAAGMITTLSERIALCAGRLMVVEVTEGYLLVQPPQSLGSISRLLLELYPQSQTLLHLSRV